MEQPKKYPRLIEVWFDGACGPCNPGGHASYGYVVNLDGVEIKSASGYVGEGCGMSNNVAEYCGVLAALEFLLENGYAGARTIVRGDSDLVIKQLSGKWKVKSGLYLEYCHRAIKTSWKFSNIEFRWIPREQNQRADELSKDPLAQRGIVRSSNPW